MCPKCFPESDTFATTAEWKSALCRKHLGKLNTRNRTINSAEKVADPVSVQQGLKED